VAKAIIKDRISRNESQLQHLCAELAVTGLMDHHNLNRRTDLLHNGTHVFIVLELCEGPRPSVLTRVAHIMARSPVQGKISGIDSAMRRLFVDASAKGVDPADEGALGDFAEQSGFIQAVLAESGVKREIPWGTDLFGLIVAMLRIPDAMSATILRQVLEGLAHLHANSVVHRDMKTENIMVAIDRRCELQRDDAGNVSGVTFQEKVDARVIDFGLVKYMNYGGVGAFSPGGFLDAAKAPAEEEDPFADSEPIVAAPAAVAPAGHFGIAVTPCGTEIYCALEAIIGIVDNGVGRNKWKSDKLTLPKVDVYGVGTAMYCMANGRPPFRPPPPRDPSVRVSREEKMRQIERLITMGAVFVAGVSEGATATVKALMDNNVAARPTAQMALRLPFVANATSNVVISSYSLAGLQSVTAGAAVGPASPAQATPILDNPHGDVAADAPDAEGDADIESAILQAARAREDDGDAAGKQ
jgi:serine/threonine protein kinase